MPQDEPTLAPHPLDGLRGYLKEHPEDLLTRIRLLRLKPFFAGEQALSQNVDSESAPSVGSRSTHATSKKTINTSPLTQQGSDLPRKPLDSPSSLSDGVTVDTASKPSVAAESKKRAELRRDGLAWNTLEEAKRKVRFIDYLRWATPPLAPWIYGMLWLATLSLLAVFSALLLLPILGKGTSWFSIFTAFGWELKIALLILSFLLFCACGCLIRSKAFPAHDPDPLFHRMLQERSPSPVSAFSVTNILADSRFPNVFYRAQNTVFPLTKKPGADVNRFIDRLIDHLNPKGQCARFFINHRISALRRDSDKLYDHLEHEMREMLFAEIFDDPAFVYIYKRNQPRWRQALAWISAFDFDRMLKLFRPGSSPKEKPDKMQLALLGLLILLVLLFLNQPKGGSPGPPSTLTLANSTQLEELTKSLRELVARLASPELPSQPHVEVHVLPPSAPIVNVPVQIADPSKASPPNNNISPNTNINMGKNSESPGRPGQSLNGSPLTNNVIVTPLPEASARPVEPPPPSTGGDDFVKLEYPRSKSPGKGIASPVDTKPLTLHTAQGLACTYTVALVDASQWPRDPVSVKVLGADKSNPADCRPAQKDFSLDNATVFSATTQPSYSGLLHAYVSVEAFHRHHLPPFAKKFIILRFHSEAIPKP